ncbi:FHA domain-containing protein [Massilia sp. S19_KUP03_FR1]|uniref:FHA domain-containing protein n=1 Tax=Massilia sp. S19_KUP03_FR1 TaxID=3025503 RepID=UPI002FCD7D31
MNKCCNPDHPHCTVWVMPGADSCVHGHAQPAAAAMSAAPAPVALTPTLDNPFDMLTALRQRRDDAPAGIHPRHPVARRPHLRISGFDPRAAGGRQSIKIDLRGLAPNTATQMHMTLASDLFAHGSERHTFAHSVDGDWRPAFVEFSSRGLEHGQYRIDVELRSEEPGERGPRAARTWVCTLMILVPRLDASLTDIHQTFLATHKNVRVMADDAGIARVNAPGGASMNIDVTARNASIAHLNLDTPSGKVDHSIGTIAWDEDLIEIATRRNEPHAFAASAASLVDAAPDHGAPRHVRLFALDECILGRWESAAPKADVLLAHYGENGQDQAGLTRRLSARHAVIRRGSRGYEIEDVSRYGILLDGVWPGKHQPIPLRLGMRIELSASIKGIVVMEVGALLPNGVILHRIDQGAGAECLYLMDPERHPGFPVPDYPCAPRACAMPVLFHRDGGFWHLDANTGRETSLGPATLVDRLTRFGRHVRFAGKPYPEDQSVRTTERRRAPAHS